MLTRRIAIDRIRSKGYKARGREVSVSAEVLESRSVNSTTSEDEHWKRHTSRRVHQALESMDETHRVLIRLSYFEGMSHSVMAEHLDHIERLLNLTPDEAKKPADLVSILLKGPSRG